MRVKVHRTAITCICAHTFCPSLHLIGRGPDALARASQKSDVLDGDHELSQSLKRFLGIGNAAGAAIDGVAQQALADPDQEPAEPARRAAGEARARV